ncbi:hypothetical protein [Paenibacillus polymyxa]|uniref:hypothetical protein n=1 Tax=Paenibacillus polymyxa TaxID=1406 RepID=UPI000A6D35A2|nr:hypothetical protein [Paenibacillus polymyxa]
MKKYVAGFLAGALFTIGATSFADEIQSLVGKKIQGETAVSVNGKSIDKAIVVEGKSYAPVRSIGEAAGMKVQFGKEGIALSDEPTKEIKPDPVTTEPISETKETKTINEEVPVKLDQLNASIEEKKEQIKSLEKGISSQQLLISQGKDVESNKVFLEGYEKSKKQAEESLANLEKQKAELEKQ